jgi:hypothetical protein
LFVYSLVQTKFLVSYVSIWQSIHSLIVVALFEMMSSAFICASLDCDRSPYACGDLLNLLIYFIAYLISWILACYPIMASLRGFTLILQALA